MEQKSKINEKLLEVLQLLGSNWSIQDYQLGGMGWTSVIVFESRKYTLHSDRGCVEIYKGDYQEQRLIKSAITANDIADIISTNI